MEIIANKTSNAHIPNFLFCMKEKKMTIKDSTINGIIYNFKFLNTQTTLCLELSQSLIRMQSYHGI